MSQNTYSACLSVFAEEHPQRAVLRFGLKQDKKKKENDERTMGGEGGIRVFLCNEVPKEFPQRSAFGRELLVSSAICVGRITTSVP